MTELIILRGLPGSGKSSLAKVIGGSHFEADMYFMNDGIYQFNPDDLKHAHAWCKDRVYISMIKNVEKIVVSNTFTQEWEMESYYKLAEEHGYRVHSIIVENRHGGVNEHGVPEDKLEIMRNRFEVKL